MTRVLTGIKPTGTIHLGNYVGAIRPALNRAAQADESFFFIADYHALNQLQDPDLFRQYTYSVAASWLCSGLDPEQSHFYRQSDIAEDFELTTILTAITPKGWMNKSHAYKAAVDKNVADSQDEDAEIKMGLYTYPILMAADILLYDADLVPVGRDQIQHIEITRDIAERINSLFGEGTLVLPNYELEAATESIPGTDGQKMSKSYDNIVPLFASKAQWKKAIYSIVTDSSERHDPKTTEGAPVFEIYSALASKDQSESLKKSLEAGDIGWGDAKSELLNLMTETLGEAAEKYDYYMNHTDELEEILAVGAARVRPIARQTLNRVRQAIGLSAS